MVRCPCDPKWGLGRLMLMLASFMEADSKRQKKDCGLADLKKACGRLNLVEARRISSSLALAGDQPQDTLSEPEIVYALALGLDLSVGSDPEGRFGTNPRS